MNQPPTTTLERRTPVGSAAGIMDTIADAVTIVAQRPWLMIVPAIVDLILLLFLRISTGPIQERMIRLLETSKIEGTEQLIEQIRANGDQIMISDYLGAFVPGLLTGISLDSVLGMLMLVIAPDGFGIPRSRIFEPWANGLTAAIDPTSALTVGGVWVGVLFLSSIAFILFRVPIVRLIRGDAQMSIARDMARGWFHFLVYLVILAVCSVLLLIPFGIIAALASILGLGLIFVVTIAMLIFGGMVAIYTLFTVDAMLLHRTSAINGFRMSFAVSRVYFGDVSRFAFTSMFLMLASLRLWAEIADSAPGFVLALIGSTFIGTALATASVIFYSDRYRLVRAMQTSDRSAASRGRNS